jgi:hypothetical protein
MHRTLIVANRTASTPVLLQEIERRSAERETAFTLLVPSVKGADWTLDAALTEMRKAARGPHGIRDAHVDGIRGDEDPFEAVKAALAQGGYDDVIISTLPKRISEWLKRDLPHRVESELDVPVTVITPPQPHGFSLFGKGAGQHERST